MKIMIFKKYIYIISKLLLLVMRRSDTKKLSIKSILHTTVWRKETLICHSVKKLWYKSAIILLYNGSTW